MHTVWIVSADRHYYIHTLNFVCLQTYFNIYLQFIMCVLMNLIFNTKDRACLQTSISTNYRLCAFLHTIDRSCIQTCYCLHVVRAYRHVTIFGLCVLTDMLLSLDFRAYGKVARCLLVLVLFLRNIFAMMRIRKSKLH